jgi:hypothetical protein
MNVITAIQQRAWGWRKNVRLKVRQEMLKKFLIVNLKAPRMWVPVTTAWRVLRFRMEERPPMWRVAVNKLNKQPLTADEGWSSSLGVGRGTNNPSQ